MKGADSHSPYIEMHKNTAVCCIFGNADSTFFWGLDGSRIIEGFQKNYKGIWFL